MMMFYVSCCKKSLEVAFDGVGVGTEFGVLAADRQSTSSSGYQASLWGP
jgi:hypothetical protein